MTSRPRLDPDLRRRADSALDELDATRDEARDRQRLRNERICRERATLSIGQLAKRYKLSRPRIIQIVRDGQSRQ